MFFLSLGLNDQNDSYVSAYTDLCRLLERSVIEQLVKDLEVLETLQFYSFLSLFFLLELHSFKNTFLIDFINIYLLQICLFQANDSLWNSDKEIYQLSSTLHISINYSPHWFQQCHVDDYVLFGHLVPFVYAKFPTEAMSSPELMKLLADSIDGHQIADIVGEIIEENISLFRCCATATFLF